MARMQNSPSVPRTNSFGPESKPIFRLVLIYEDMASGKRAMRTCQALIDKIGEEFEFRNSLWSFDVLQLSKTQSEAAHEAAAADMIMIAARGTEPLPEFVSRWIENWAGQKRSRRGALVALIETGEHFVRGTSPVHSYLRGIAENAPLDFFCQETSSSPARSFRSSSAL